ncbi:MAG: methyltransferase domain-containing protein [Pararhodobacter sp.]|nr:methyltransferase domain-containing protein [Pararhodobacter sp.]
MALGDHLGRPAGRSLGHRLAGSRRFQAFAARVPVLRRLVRAEGAAIFDIMQGFVRSQVLMALVDLRVLHRLAEGAGDTGSMARRCGLPEARMAVLLQAGAGLELVRRRGAEFSLSHRGMAFLAVPGLDEMVRHHRVLYGDLADPAAFFRGETDPALAHFWPYVLGGAGDSDAAARYSRLMAESQALVAEETLAQVSLSGIRHLMDVGGGTGAFLRAVRARAPSVRLTLFDLPEVVAQAALPADVARMGGSFRAGLPQGDADAISLIRVLYDHADDTVRALLAAAHDALPPGGRLILSEPMSGGLKPDPQVDVYFSVYTLAMQTGRTRSPSDIALMLRSAGFGSVTNARNYRPFVTSSITARRPA